MNGTVAFIGAGSMGGAILRAVCRALPPERVYVSNRTAAKALSLAKECGCHAVESNAAAVEAGDYIFLCVKPQLLPGVLAELSPVLNAELAKGRSLCLVSIAAGVQIASIRAQLTGESAKMPVLRIMPNLAVSIGKGMLALSDDGAPEEKITDVEAILAQAGRTDRLEEARMDAFSAIAGCLPAYVFLFIEALADGAVLTGLPRAQAMEYAAQTIVGSAQLNLETGTHPGALKDAVCSPGGSTIAGIAALEHGGFRAAAMDAIVAAYEKNVALGK